jgi:hypothetical protein
MRIKLLGLTTNDHHEKVRGTVSSQAVSDTTAWWRRENKNKKQTQNESRLRAVLQGLRRDSQTERK